MSGNESKEEILNNIRAIIVSSKGPVLLSYLYRDYETVVGYPIDYQRFNFSSLEEFLRSLPSLRVCGTGGRAMVEAATKNDSKHVSDLISKQKPSKKPPFRGGSFYAPPPPRGRGGRGRGRGGYYVSTRGHFRTNSNYLPRDTYRERPPRESIGENWDSSNQDSPKKNSPPPPVNFTVKVDGDYRKVEVTHKQKEKEVPPRFQKSKPKPVTPEPPATIEPPPSTVDPQNFDSSVFLGQPSSAANSRIISPLGPGQLVSAGLAKKEAEKAKKQHLNSSSNFLLHSATNGENGLAAGFARLTHQDSASSLENPLGNPVDNLVEARGKDLLRPDTSNLPNNILQLENYCYLRGWPEPKYTILEEGRSGLFFASVKVNGGGDNTFVVSTLPFEHRDQLIVKGFAALKAIEKILTEETKVKSDRVVNKDKSIICNRIRDIVAGTSTGMFARSVEDEYVTRYNELLPSDWQKTVHDWPYLAVESTVSSTIIIPKEPVTELFEYPPNPGPPYLPVQSLGNSDQSEAVYITHATSPNNVYFRVISNEHSEQYEHLLENMDKYYNGIGKQDLALVVEVGQYYAAFKANTWFRVYVTDVDEEQKQAVAWLIDLGDSDYFPFGSLYRLTQQFCQLPRQAVQCTLDGLEVFFDDPVANQVVSFSDLLLEKVLIAKITSRNEMDGYVTVSLYDTSGEDDVDVNLKLKDEIILSTKNELPPEGQAREFAIGHVSNRGEVYLTCLGPALDRILEILESLSTERLSELKLSNFNLSHTKMYLAKFSTDGKWYRAKIAGPPSRLLNKIPIRFVDFGNEETVGINSLADINTLPEILKELPPQSVMVQLNKLPPNSLTNPEVATLHSLLLDQVKAFLIKPTDLSANPPVVEIFTKEDDQAYKSVSEIIDIQRQQYRSDMNFNKLLAVPNDLEPRHPDIIPFEPLDLIVRLPAHPGHFIFQIQKYSDDLEELTQQMAKYYQTDANVGLDIKDVKEHCLYAAYYEDKWYRVSVKYNKVSGNRVAVRLIDYGDCVCVHTSSLRQLPAIFRELPLMAIKGGIANIRPSHRDWTVEDCIRFKQLVSDRPLLGTVIEVQPDQENPAEIMVTLILMDKVLGMEYNIGDILLTEQRAVKA
ncbi:tudor domain-containing protein 7-like isoform X3 [Macrosteles quadrilineatus]|uniref:tudor domain-containing protein 7-like isoform X3 n=1 Tax=Macrosteles quadrilineatus TaxID=74068 RepID=UPI0023E2EA35|nr:tudor domain-containing protein 7-like isoform X3 [Macrosteles quadrilineatus]